MRYEEGSVRLGYKKRHASRDDIDASPHWYPLKWDCILPPPSSCNAPQGRSCHSCASNQRYSPSLPPPSPPSFERYPPSLS